MDFTERLVIMKKFGFTIAETLIAMAIIGVIAALVMPTFSTGANKEGYAKTLSAITSDFESAMGELVLKEGVEELGDTKAWRNLNSYSLNSSTAEGNITEFLNGIVEIYPLNYDSSKKNSGEYYDSEKVFKLSGDEISLSSEDIFKNALPFEIKKGGVIFINISGYTRGNELDIMKQGGNLYTKAASVIIDINGIKKPNIIGRDIFKFILSGDGKLYPFGSFDYDTFMGDSHEDPKDLCDTTNDGYACGAYLFENGYKMDY